MFFAVATRFAPCAFPTGYHGPADAQQLVELQRLAHAPEGFPVIGLGCAWGSNERCNCSQLPVRSCLVWGCRKDGEPPLSAVIHLLGINCSSMFIPPVQGPRQAEQHGAGSASSLPGSHPWSRTPLLSAVGIARTCESQPGAFKPCLDFS